MEEAMETRIKGRRFQITLAVTGSVAFLLQGYDQALMDGLLTLPTFVEQFPSIDTSTTTLASRNSTFQGTVVALYEVGAAIGALSCFVVGDKYGRKNTTFGAAFIVLSGAILQSTSYSISQLIVARIWTGLGVGSFTATIPTWVGESVPAQSRGRFVMLEGAATIFGVAFVSWLEFGFYFVRESTASWRFPIALQALFGLFVLSVVPVLSESPRWLASKGRQADAKAVLAKLGNYHIDSIEVISQLDVINRAIDLSGQEGSHNPFARTPMRYLNRTLLAIAVNVFSQLCGVNIITFYSNITFEGVLGFSGIESRIITASLQVWQFIGAAAAMFFIERFGRRKLLLLGAGGMALAQAGLAGIQAYVQSNRTAAGCSLVFYFIALASFPIGLFLVPFMYASEIAPLSVRAKVTALSTATNWLLNFVIAEITPKAFDRIGWKYYLIFLVCNVVAFISVYLFAPETKGRSLEEIDAIFVKSNNAFDPVRVAQDLLISITQDPNSLIVEKDGTKVSKVESTA